jgi:hypothetical protein
VAARDLVSARYPGLDAGYESYFLRAADPAGGRGLWIRYTVHRRAGHRPTGSLWFTLFDASRPPLAVKRTVPDVGTGAGSWLEVAGSAIGPGRAHGEIDVPGHDPVGWDLSFEGGPLHPHLPRSWMYDAPLPRTKPVSLHPAARLRGRLVVGDLVLDVAGWPGMVGHNWGSEHAERWIWLHGSAFGDDPDSWIDVVLARLRIGGWTTPWSGFGALSLDGRVRRFGGLSRVRSTRVDEHPDRAAFSLSGDHLRVHGTVGAPLERFVGWEYADPDGSSHDVAHCSIADLEVTLEERDQPPRALRSTGTAAYELGMREHDHGLTIQPFPDG